MILTFISSRYQYSTAVGPLSSPSVPPDVSTVPQTMILAFSSSRFHHRTSVRPRSLHSVSPDVRTVPQLDHDHCLQFLQISGLYFRWGIVLACSSSIYQHSTAVRPWSLPSIPPDVRTVSQTTILAFSSCRCRDCTSFRIQSLPAVPPNVRSRSFPSLTDFITTRIIVLCYTVWNTENLTE